MMLTATKQAEGLGNRTNVNVRDGNDITYTVDDLTNRYTSIEDANLSYDEAGNLTTDKDSYEYEYDYENRIVKITKDGNDIAEFAYDALGRRIRKIDSVAGQTTYYYNNYKWQVLYETGDTGTKSFVYGNYIDEVLYRVPFFYYIHDHLYSPVAMVSWTGAVLERYEYDAYGNPYILDTQYAPRTTSNYGNPYLFTGRRLDYLDSGSLKIQYNRNRYYDYYSGRWLTHDPMGITSNCRKPNEFRPLGQYKDTLNLYEMMNSNPVLGNDPWGLSGLLWKFHEACMSKKLRDILKELIKMAELTTVSDRVFFGGGYPYGHCMWSCEMTKDKDKGEKYAEEMGEKKEELDEAFADWADTISDSCWKKWSSKKREEVAAWVCSADQTSDHEDNAAGRDCGSDSVFKALPCWDCCVNIKRIARDTPEGDKKRPFGPRCHGRYKKEVEKKLGRSVVVENPR